MEGSEVLKELMCQRFGAESLCVDGTLNRKYLASIVFGDDNEREWLNGHVHAMVRKDLAGCLEACEKDFLFVESAILKSSRLDMMCDSVWLVEAPMELRLKRVAVRERCDKEQVIMRMRAQRSEFVGLENVEVICNDNLHPLLPQIDSLLKLNTYLI